MYFYCKSLCIIIIVVYVFLLFVHVFLTLSMYSYCSSMYSYCCLWHKLSLFEGVHKNFIDSQSLRIFRVYVFLDAATLTEVFLCFFLGCKANARVILAKTGHGPHSSKIVVLFYVLFILHCSMYCLCVNVYCHRVTTQLQLTNIYHIITLRSLYAFVERTWEILRFFLTLKRPEFKCIEAYVTIKANDTSAVFKK